MSTALFPRWSRRWFSAWLSLGWLLASGAMAAPADLEVGLAVRDITPDLPIRLAGYAARNRPADKVDHPLLVQAMALKNPAGERFVLVSLDNCEVSQKFMEPVVQQYSQRYQMPRGTVAVVSSHTHSGPVLDDTLTDMAQPKPDEQRQIAQYSEKLRKALVEVVGAALTNYQPALLEYGLARAGFAMNRRVYQGDKVAFGDNPDGPVDWDVPILRIKGTNGTSRAILFGYACHGTSVRTGDDWYVVSGEYMAYARGHLEAHEPGVMAMFVPGMGADQDPSPRGLLVHAKRHGLELAGAMVGTLDRNMRPVRGSFKMGYEEVEVPLVDPPDRSKLEKDAQDQDPYIRSRAQAYLRRLEKQESLPQSVTLPIAAVRIGDQLTFLLMGGEVVVDYGRRLKRELAEDHPWTIGYAYHVPCYIPTARLIKEGGYETESSMIYYGYYGPFKTSAEDLLIKRMTALVAGLRDR